MDRKNHEDVNFLDSADVLDIKMYYESIEPKIVDNDRNFNHAAMECNVVIEGLLDINSNHMKIKMKNASTFEKLNKLYCNVLFQYNFR